MKTTELLEALRGHYIPEAVTKGARDGGVFAHEVSMNGAGGGPVGRRADALYCGFTSASGRVLIGHELKVSRADWRTELSKVGKADPWADACHAWYIVAPSTEIVPPEELPEGWGLLLPPRSSRGRRMQIAVKAAVKADHDPPWWAMRSFMARVDTLEHERKVAEINRLVELRVKDWRESMERAQQGRQLSMDEQMRLRALEALEKELGVSVTFLRSRLGKGEVSAEAVARGVRIAGAMDSETRMLDHLDQQLKWIQECVEGMQTALPQARALANGEGLGVEGG